MPSIVTCPGCQKRLKLGADKPGGKLRCPACNTPFVLGSRTNEGTSGPAEFLAFELFEDQIESEFEVIEDKPAKSSKTTIRSSPDPTRPEQKTPPSAKTPSPPPVKQLTKAPPSAPPPARQPARNVGDLLPDDLDLLGVGPVRTPADTDDGEEPERPIFPDEFAGLVEEPGQTPLKQFEIIPSAPRGESRSEPKPRVETKSRVESRHQPKPEPKSASQVESRNEPKTAANVEDFFLPANFDLGSFSAPASKPSPILDLSLDDDIKLEGEPKKQVDWEIIDTSPKLSADGVPIIEGATQADITRFESRPPDYEDISADDAESRPRNRAERRQRRMMKRAVRQAINADVRGRWAMVFWGITFELAATVCFGIAIALVVLSMATSLLGVVVKSPPLFVVAGGIWVLVFGLIAFSSVFDLIGRGLSIPCPAKNNAMLWAVLSAVLGLAGIVGLVPLTFVGQIFYLVFLKFAAEALKEYSLAQECMHLIKLLIVTAIVSAFLFLFGIGTYFLGGAAVAASHDPNDATTLSWIMGAMSLIFIVVMIILSAVVTYKYFEILSEFRQELRWRLES